MVQKSILVIDDEQVVLDSVAKVLGAEDHAVEVSLSGRRGLDRAVSAVFDLVLTDIRMPDMGGLEILRDLKRAKPELPVIIITGFGTVALARQSMTLGAAYYLEKPFTPEELISAVDAAFAKAAAEAPENQALLHCEEVHKVLERITRDSTFATQLLLCELSRGVEVLEEYRLTGPEKLALLTGDVEWLERYLGSLTPDQKRWLELRLVRNL